MHIGMIDKRIKFGHHRLKRILRHSRAFRPTSDMLKANSKIGKRRVHSVACCTSSLLQWTGCTLSLSGTLDVVGQAIWIGEESCMARLARKLRTPRRVGNHLCLKGGANDLVKSCVDIDLVHLAKVRTGDLHRRRKR